MCCRCSEIWFDDVDDVLIEPSKTDLAAHKTDPLVKPYSFDGWVISVSTWYSLWRAAVCKSDSNLTFMARTAGQRL